MKGNKTERYIKGEISKAQAPEAVWEKIKDKPILVYSDSGEGSKAYVKTRRGAAAAVAAALVIVAAAAAVNGGDIFKQPPIDAAKGSDRENALIASEEDTADNAASAPSVTEDGSAASAPLPSGTDSGLSMGVCVSCYMVFDHRLYTADCESGLTESDLGDKYTQMQNEHEVSVYSVKGVPLAESFAVKANGMIIRYDFLYSGVFEFGGEKYGIVDKGAYYYPEPQKGKYLGTAEGMKVYEFVGNDKAVLIDLNPVAAIDGDSDEFLYAAEKLS